MYSSIRVYMQIAKDIANDFPECDVRFHFLLKIEIANVKEKKINKISKDKRIEEDKRKYPSGRKILIKTFVSILYLTIGFSEPNIKLQVCVCVCVCADMAAGDAEVFYLNS